MVGLYQNAFYGSSKCFSIGNDFNGIVIKFTLKNIFNTKYAYLVSFIYRINVITARKAIQSSKMTCRKNKLRRPNILLGSKGKKIQKFKSGNKCSIKRWYQFDVLFFITS